ncbi:homeobox protein CDX-4-like [Pelodytes ibericus]
MNITCGNPAARKEASMYPLSVRSNNNNHHTGQNYVSNQSYINYVAYHHVPNMDNQGQSCGVWGSQYGSPREDWNSYAGPPSNPCAVQPADLSPNQFAYSSLGYNSPHPAAPGIIHSVDTTHTAALSPNTQSQNSYDWMRKTVQSTSTGKTRTKEKYRVVYTDHQRLELEKEFHYSRYITIRRKTELAANLRLSERQVKIWFQNRRAKERKLYKKKMTQFDGTGSVQSDSGSASPNILCDSVMHMEMPSSLYQPPPLTVNSLQPNGIIQPTGCGLRARVMPPGNCKEVNRSSIDHRDSECIIDLLDGSLGQCRKRQWYEVSTGHSIQKPYTNVLSQFTVWDVAATSSGQ